MSDGFSGSVFDKSPQSDNEPLEPSHLLSVTVVLGREIGDTVSEITVLEGVKGWKQRRNPPLKDEEIAQAIRDLNLLGWIKAKPSSDLPLSQEAALLDV